MSDKEYDINIKTTYDKTGFKKAQDDIKKIAKDAQATDVESSKAAKSMSQFVDELEKASTGSKDVADSVQNITTSTNNVHNATTKTAGGFKNIGYGALQASYFIDDMQYGMKGIMNNIPGLVMGFGGGMGLAGALGIAVVAANQLWQYFGEGAEKGKKKTKEVNKELEAIAEARETIAEDIENTFKDINLSAISASITDNQNAITKSISESNDERLKTLEYLDEELTRIKRNQLAQKGIDTKNYDLNMIKLKGDLADGKISQKEYDYKAILERQSLDELLSKRDLDLNVEEAKITNAAIDTNRKALNNTGDALFKSIESLRKLGYEVSDSGAISEASRDSAKSNIKALLAERQEAYNNMSTESKHGEEYQELGFDKWSLDRLKSGDMRYDEFSKTTGKGIYKKLGEKIGKEMDDLFWKGGKDGEGYKKVYDFLDQNKIVRQSNRLDERMNEAKNNYDTKYNELNSILNPLGIKAPEAVNPELANREKSQKISEQANSITKEFDKAEKTVIELSSEYKKHAESLKQSEKKRQNLDEDMERLQASIKKDREIRAANIELQRKIEEKNKRDANTKEELKSLEDRKKRLPEITRENQKLYANSELYGNEFKQSAELDQLRSFTENEIANALSDNKIDFSEARAIKSAVEKQALALSEGKANIDKIMKNLNGVFGGISSKYDDMNRSLSSLNREIETIKNKLRLSGHAK